MERDVLKEKWCCLTCSTVMEAGVLRSGGDKPYLHCPHCGSGDISPANGAVRTVPEYFGPIGTRN